MKLTIDTVDDVPAELLSGQWRYSAASLAPRRLCTTAADARWATRWTVARSAGQAVGIVSSHQPRAERFINDAYDLGAMSDSLGREAPADPRRWVFVGGCRDFTAGVVTGAGLSDEDSAEVRSALAAHVFTEAEAAGDYPVALHVRASEVAAFTAGLTGGHRACELSDTAHLALTGSTVDDYVAALPKSQRERFRRDRRKFDALGYTAGFEPAGDVVAEAAPMICAVKEKYGVVEHPRLVAYRLKEWAAAFGPENCHASVVRDSDGRLLAVSFLTVQGDILEGYEIGMADDVAGREFAYLQAMIYAPIGFGYANACRTIDLGLDSSDVKQRRGATITKTWAISLS
ncbi:GNAT family N-acetyltransferase [Actinokineospora xionganensis]|uniref:GNAT family N-acetyltransferase n=1 Tax=Actinokineospora xionganensis TaxID=2684470 RepID=A0ABR7L3Z2_9PSEU|nr:GNAT family N-acetyltransferase [Actinokineospora xionganensis]MBC6447410.1 GNAT family N-acetyltransferase [Actinokineospora xionganensis]